MKASLLLPALCLMTGCTTSQSTMPPSTLADYESAGIITKVDVEQGKYVTLHCKGIQPKFSDTYLGGYAWTHGAAVDAARQYRSRLHADYVIVEMVDANGTLISVGDDGTPTGYHWSQDGVEFQNGPFGPVDIHPTYGLKRD